MWRLLNLPTQQIAMHYMHAERHMGGSLVYAGSWAQSLLPKPNYLCQQLRKSSTQGSSSKPDCWHSNSGTVWYRKANHRRKCSFSQSDNHGPTRRPSLASCKKGAAYCKQFWIPSACQNSDPFTSSTIPWRIWLTKSYGSTVGGKQRGKAVEAFTTLTGKTVQKTGILVREHM